MEGRPGTPGNFREGGLGVSYILLYRPFPRPYHSADILLPVSGIVIGGSLMRNASTLALLLAMAASAWAQDQQIGARTKGMGGSYTAFEDDPISVWLNPAGIATQPDQMSLCYQTYLGFPV